MVEIEAAIMVEIVVAIVVARKVATLAVAKRVPKEILILTRTSIVPYMKGKGMM